MKWSWRVAKVAGIDVYIHFTFLILLAFIGWSHYAEGNGFGEFARGILLIVLLFSIVLLHELGHSLMARRFGIGTREITLLPIGGLARLERMPEEPRQEFLVAIAGPAVNVVLAVLCFVLLMVQGRIVESTQIQIVGGDLLTQLLYVNIMLVLFNMLPAFPMDGGRVLRALLATRMEFARATRIAANVGQGMALLFFIAGVFMNPMLLFIAIIVWIGAEGEANFVELKTALSGYPVSKAMITSFRTLPVHAPITAAIEYILAGYQQDFPVLDNGKIAGVLTRKAIMKALSEKGDSVMVEDVMDRDFVTARPDERLEDAFMRLQACECPAVPVVLNDQVVGILTMENVGEFMMVQTALRNKNA